MTVNCETPWGSVELFWSSVEENTTQLHPVARTARARLSFDPQSSVDLHRAPLKENTHSSTELRGGNYKTAPPIFINHENTALLLHRVHLNVHCTYFNKVNILVPSIFIIFEGLSSLGHENGTNTIYIIRTNLWENHLIACPYLVEIVSASSGDTSKTRA